MDPQADRELLKRGPKRSAHVETAPGPGEGGRRVVKRFHGPDLLDRFRDRLRARNEYGLLGRCKALGLPVPRALELRRQDGSWEVVTEYVENAPTLDDWLRGSRPGPSWQKLARDLGRLVAQLMGIGLAHGDLHPGNFLVQERTGEAPRLWLIDLTKSRLRGRLGADRMVQDLVQLTAGLRELVSDRMRRRFLVEFQRQLPIAQQASLPSRAELGRRIEDRARVFRRRDIERRTRRWLRNSSSVEPYDGERGHGFVSRAASPELVPAILGARARSSWQGEGRVDVDGHGAWVIDGRSWSTQRESWKRQVRLFTHGLPCLTPLCISRHPGGWMALDLGPDLVPVSLGTFDPQDSAVRQRIIESFGRLVGALHDRQLEVQGLRFESLWANAEGELHFGLTPGLADRNEEELLRADGPHTSAIQSWSGPWSESDHQVFLNAYTSALSHSDAERARVLGGGEP